jgi:uracil-DNA glycosylase
MDTEKKSGTLHYSWALPLEQEFEAAYMKHLKSFLLERKQSGAHIFPEGKNYFHALNSTPLDDVKVVILGQDPYHGAGQAHGLCFSVNKGVRIPPSLQNIYKEIADDIGCSIPEHGCLENWANQGVLLLNSVLTVEEGNAGAHAGKGWEQFTDKIVQTVNEETTNTVFMLWGSYAHKKGACIDTDKHLVLKAVHPSPLSAHRGFLGCKHFSQANSYLQKHGKKPIDWQV